MNMKRGAGEEVLDAYSATLALPDGTAERTLELDEALRRLRHGHQQRQAHARNPRQISIHILPSSLSSRDDGRIRPAYGLYEFRILLQRLAS
jgi:hypothetical protein